MPKKSVTSEEVLALYHALPTVSVCYLYVEFQEKIAYKYSRCDGTKLVDDGQISLNHSHRFGKAYSEHEMAELVTALEKMSEAQFHKLGLAMSWLTSTEDIMHGQCFTSKDQYKSVKRTIVNRTITIKQQQVM
jgi:hypothetical protein